MTYKHDIFVSYRRDDETRLWLDKHFVPLLQTRVRPELGKTPRIYVDTQLESGESWPERLGIELGRSRVLVPLLSGDYFSSPWCLEEFSLMLAREEECSLRTVDAPRGLIVPALVHDGEHFAPEVAAIQRFTVVDQFNSRMPKLGKMAAALSTILAREAPAIVAAIAAAPPWRPAWDVEGATRFRQILRTPNPSQRSVPRFG